MSTDVIDDVEGGVDGPKGSGGGVGVGGFGGDGAKRKGIATPVSFTPRTLKHLGDASEVFGQRIRQALTFETIECWVPVSYTHLTLPTKRIV